MKLQFTDHLKKRLAVMYQKKIRKVLAAYDKIVDKVEVITSHPITDKQIEQRVNSGRWSYEKNKN